MNSVTVLPFPWVVEAMVSYEDNPLESYGRFIRSIDGRTRVVSDQTADKLYGEGRLGVSENYTIECQFVPRNFEEDTTFLFEDPMDHRPDWDEYFMRQAVNAATRATCNRLKVGAVLVRGNRPVAQGYNGSRHGQPHCHDVGCLMHSGSCKRTVHAEKNVIDMCAKFGIPTDALTMYVTHYPCPDCMQTIGNVGIKEVVFLKYYKHKYNNDFHEGLLLRQYDGRPIE